MTSSIIIVQTSTNLPTSNSPTSSLQPFTSTLDDIDMISSSSVDSVSTSSIDISTIDSIISITNTITTQPTINATTISSDHVSNIKILIFST